MPLDDVLDCGSDRGGFVPESSNQAIRRLRSERDGSTVIRYVPVRCLLVRLFSSEDAIMVSPSGTQGTGSTKVRAGRR